MPLYKLSETQSAAFDEQHEVAMDIHMGRLGDKDCAVIGSRVAIIFDETAIEQARALSIAPDRQGDRAVLEEAYANWFETLSIPSSIEPVRGRAAKDALLAMRLSARPSASAAAPKPPTSIYGHLPFAASSSGGQVFYRFEAFPKSRRLHGTSIAPDTFAAPQSEATLVPTGFAAVGRYALPSLFPAIFVHRIEPNPATPFYCGACVPLYGQSGGGVEVYFHKGGTNRTRFTGPGLLAPY